MNCEQNGRSLFIFLVVFLGGCFFRKSLTNSNKELPFRAQFTRRVAVFSKSAENAYFYVFCSFFLRFPGMGAAKRVRRSWYCIPRIIWHFFWGRFEHDFGFEIVFSLSQRQKVKIVEPKITKNQTFLTFFGVFFFWCATLIFWHCEHAIMISDPKKCEKCPQKHPCWGAHSRKSQKNVLKSVKLSISSILGRDAAILT